MKRGRGNRRKLTSVASSFADLAYITVKVATNRHVRSFGPENITKSLDFIVPEAVETVRMKKESSLRDLHQSIAEKEGVPVSRQRFWTCIRRENQTIRPDQLFYYASDPDFDEALAEINEHLDIAPFYNGGTKLCDVLLYMEEVPWQKCIQSMSNANEEAESQVSEADPGS